MSFISQLHKCSIFVKIWQIFVNILQHIFENNSNIKQKGGYILKDNTQHGNYAKINKDKKIIPKYQTYTLTSKKEQNSNEVPLPLEENQTLAKQEVDANQK